MGPNLRVPRHRATTAQVASAFPFVDRGVVPTGVYLGAELLSGGRGFGFDPFEAYRAGLVTNPNMVMVGEPGSGKSAATKCLLHRTAGVLGRWLAVIDPKGEYGPLAHALGLTVVRLAPGGAERLNPLARPGAAGEDMTAHQAAMAVTLIGGVLRRDLTALEETAVAACLTHLAQRGREVTVGDLAQVVADPPEQVAARARVPAAELAAAMATVSYGLDKLCQGSLRGMFDGTSTVRLDPNGPGVVIDLSAVHHDPNALAAVTVATLGWLQAVMAQPGPMPRIQALDEAWCLLATERTSRYLQASWKLGRASGIANLAVVHRLSDLRSQSDDGTTAAKLSEGLLADTQTRVLFRQASDQLGDARRSLGLTTTEANLLTRLCRGRALWKIGDHTAVVQHTIAPAEHAMCDTDARMGA